MVPNQVIRYMSQENQKSLPLDERRILISEFKPTYESEVRDTVQNLLTVKKALKSLATKGSCWVVVGCETCSLASSIKRIDTSFRHLNRLQPKVAAGLLSVTKRVVWRLLSDAMDSLIIIILSLLIKIDRKKVRAILPNDEQDEETSGGSRGATAQETNREERIVETPYFISQEEAMSCIPSLIENPPDT
ncbi:8121_t:CDS:2, partial [Gigaspora rosea]